jgi:hypothetical protein
VLWLAAAASSHIRAARVLAAGEATASLALARKRQLVLGLEHVCLLLLLGSGAALMWQRGWGLGQARWLGVKLGLVVFLLVPLEGIHAYVGHVWIRRGLRQTATLPYSKDLRRGLGMDEMIRTLSLLLLGLAVPLMIWLSVVKPF